MSSSDSDDDCYGNVAQKLQSLKNNYVPEKVETVTSKRASKQVSTTTSLSTKEVTTSSVVVEDINSTLNSTDNDELTLDAIIAQNTKGLRSKKRKSEEEFEPIYEREKRSSRRKTANSNGRRGKRGDCNTEATDIPGNETSAPTTSAATSRVETNTNITTSATTRGRGRSRARAATPRGRGRGRGRRRNTISNWLSNAFEVPTSANNVVNAYPIYSVGNTDEYPDDCESQQLFSTAAPTRNEVLIIEDEDPLATDNEELSVKVYWQNLEVVRFNIRKYQKLMPIFKYFSERENICNDKLLFMYNDKIIKSDDTPDGINYSIGKFIDGGIVNQNVSSIINETHNSVKGGMRLKFQCQNKKKPFETRIRPQDNMALAMLKCAEHLETTVERLKFYFDGDLISTKNTPQDLGLEDGECIDVKIVS